MSEELPRSTPTYRTQGLRRRLQRLRTSRRRGMFGVAEIIALAGGLVVLLTVVISYIYFLAPARSNLQRLQAERGSLQGQLRNLQELTRKGGDTQSTVDRIVASVEGFERDHLAARMQGRMGLYDELNQLIGKNGLRNTSGPSYSPLDPTGSKTNGTESKSTSTKWQSVYPGISVSLTVEGSYQNLRSFIRSLEASKQFIIINAIELERATETGAPTPAEGPSASGRGSLVSLRLDMATYFQRGHAESEQN